MVGFLIAVVATGLYFLYAASVAISEYAEARSFDRERAQVARVADEVRARVRSIDLVRAGRQSDDREAFLAEHLGMAISAHCDVSDDEVWTRVPSGDFGYREPALVVEEFDLCWTIRTPPDSPYRVFVRGTEQLRMLAEGARLGSTGQRVDIQRVHSGQALTERVYPPERLRRHTVKLATLESALPDLEWRVGEAATSGSDAFARTTLGREESGGAGPARDAFAHEKHHAMDSVHARVGLRMGLFSEEDLGLPIDDPDEHELPEPEKTWARDFHDRLWTRMEWAPDTAVGNSQTLRSRTRELVAWLQWSGETDED